MYGVLGIDAFIYNIKEIWLSLFQRKKRKFKIISYLSIFMFENKNYVIHFYPKKVPDMIKR